MQHHQEQQGARDYEQGCDIKRSGCAEQLASSQRARRAVQAALAHEEQVSTAAAEMQERKLRACRNELQACKLSLTTARSERSAMQSAVEASNQACKAAAGELAVRKQQLAVVQQDNGVVQALLQGPLHAKRGRRKAAE